MKVSKSIRNRLILFGYKEKEGYTKPQVLGPNIYGSCNVYLSYLSSFYSPLNCHTPSSKMFCSRPHHKSMGSLNHNNSSSKRQRPAPDNTFRRELFPSAHIRSVNNFTKQEQRQRGYHEFEDGNQRRLIKRQNDNYTPSYMYRHHNANRPPTGVDMALGLNGFQNLSVTDAPVRTPTTLMPMEGQGKLIKNVHN